MFMMGSVSYSSAQRLPFFRNSTGKERDAETGLDYFGARYYSGAQARFTSAVSSPNGIAWKTEDAA
jgi:RHS repeat-associated protein